MGCLHSTTGSSPPAAHCTLFRLFSSERNPNADFVTEIQQSVYQNGKGNLQNLGIIFFHQEKQNCISKCQKRGAGWIKHKNEFEISKSWPDSYLGAIVYSWKAHSSCFRKHYSSLSWQRTLILSTFYSRPLPNIWMEIPTDGSPSLDAGTSKAGHGSTGLSDVMWCI